MTRKFTLSEKLGMHPQLAIGYLGLLLFMIGDGVESGFLSPYLLDLHFSQNKIALVFTLYGVAAALASWLSGVLSDLLGPKKVMWAGLIIWLVLEIPFLTLGLAHHNYPITLLCYMIRGLGYPLFAFGFLVWVTAITPHRYLATSVGWFWFARTGGLPTLGSLFASYSVTRHGPYMTLWYSVSFVALGGFIALFGINEPRGTKPLGTGNENPFRVLLSGFSIIWKVPKVGLGGIVAVITTTSEFGFLLFLPIFYIHTVGFTLSQWLQILTVMFATNIFFNLFWGWVGDKIGWRTVITIVGACGCAAAALGLYYVPHIFGPNYTYVMLAGMGYGATLAGFVPLGAIMATLAPQSPGAALSIYSLGSGISIWLGPAIAGIFLPLIGVGGVMWIFATMYLLAAVVGTLLKTPQPEGAAEAESELFLRRANTTL
jgi:polyol permease family